MDCSIFVRCLSVNCFSIFIKTVQRYTIGGFMFLSGTGLINLRDVEIIVLIAFPFNYSTKMQ